MHFLHDFEKERKRAFYLFIVCRRDWSLYGHWLANHAVIPAGLTTVYKGRNIA